MPHSRAHSEASLKVPHAVSLKVLRLSRPQLEQQYPLPPQSAGAKYPIDAAASLAHPQEKEDTNGKFILTPGLLLPASFGSIFVGSTFTCTLCANNELPNARVAGVSISAEIQHPGDQEPIPLALEPTNTDKAAELEPGATLQKVVRAELPDEGVYTLAVTVSYNDQEGSAPSEDLNSTLSNSELAERDQDTNKSLKPADSIKTRTFRKLYQFAAHQLLAVRTKSRLVPAKKGKDSTPIVWAIEAQLENLSTAQIVLEKLEMVCVDGCVSRSLNPWDLQRNTNPAWPSIGSKEVLQVAFLVTGIGKGEDRTLERTNDGRIVFGQLRLRWRSSMGETGTLNTGWLSGKIP